MHWPSFSLCISPSFIWVFRQANEILRSLLYSNYSTWNSLTTALVRFWQRWCRQKKLIQWFNDWQQAIDPPKPRRCAKHHIRDDTKSRLRNKLFIMKEVKKIYLLYIMRPQLSKFSASTQTFILFISKIFLDTLKGLTEVTIRWSRSTEAWNKKAQLVIEKIVCKPPLNDKVLDD